jgi:hypothetical protein
MANSSRSSPADSLKIWDILLLKQDGQWTGFRASWTTLQRTATYFVLVFLLGAVSTVGWLWSRWQLSESERDLAVAQLEIASLKAKVSQASRRGSSGQDPAAGALPKGVGVLPSLDDVEVSTESLALAAVVAEYAPTKQQWSLRFEARRSGGAGERVYWMALLHGPQGILSFPPSLASRAGDLVVPQRGQALEPFSGKRAVTARFKVGDFMENAGSEPVYVSLLIYDGRGSLLAKQRHALSLEGSTP